SVEVAEVAHTACPDVLPCLGGSMEEHVEVKVADRRTHVEGADDVRGAVFALTDAVLPVDHAVVIVVDELDVARSCIRPVRVVIDLFLCVENTVGDVKKAGVPRLARIPLPRQHPLSLGEVLDLVFHVGEVRTGAELDFVRDPLREGKLTLDAPVAHLRYVFAREAEPGYLRNGLTPPPQDVVAEVPEVGDVERKPLAR